jgi:hypothetical protein
MPQAANWFHAHQDTIGRSSGRTATGIASYVTGQRIKDEETGRWLKRNHPGDVLAFGTVTPAGSPEYLSDNQQLARAWNEAQRADSRKNAQLARHWNIALSRDLTKEQQIEVMQAIAQAFTGRYGTMTTWAVHSPTGHGDARNAHGHIVHNMRMVTPDGFGPKVLEPVVFKTAKREMEWARGMIADAINAGLERAGLDERVTHLSYDAQGIDREAKKHLGDKQNQAELKGEATPTGDHNRGVDARNEQRETEARAGQAAQAQLSAEIIDLQDERRRRNRGMEPAQANDETARQQAEKQRDAYRQAEQAHQEQQGKEHSTRQLAEDGKRQAEEAERDKEKRQAADKARAESGEPADARSRYAQAIGENFSINDPFGSLAKAAMSEYETFTKEQQALKEQVAKEQDPEKKRMIEMRREIEAHDYMAITHERLAGISRAITRGDNDSAQKDDRDASRHRARSMELRAERDGRANDNEKPRQQDRQQEPQRQPADGDSTAPQKETATGRAPITNIQHTGNKAHTMTKAERIEEARKLYFASMGGASPDAKDPQRDTGRDAQRDMGRDTQNNPEREIIARQAEETKQREGLQTDQPAETARASTKEGRDIATKEEARAAYDAAMRGDSAASFREAGQEATRPSGRGGGKGR